MALLTRVLVFLARSVHVVHVESMTPRHFSSYLKDSVRCDPDQPASSDDEEEEPPTVTGHIPVVFVVLVVVSLFLVSTFMQRLRTSFAP